MTAFGGGQGSSDPLGSSARQEPSGPPRTVRLAWWMWLAGVLLGLVRTVVQLSDRKALISRMSRISPELSQTELDAAANSSILMTLLLSLTLAAVYMLLANRMLGRRNWARIVMLVIAILGVVGTVFGLLVAATLGSTVSVGGFSVSMGILDVLFSVVIAAADVAVAVLLLHPESNGFFRGRPRREAAARPGLRQGDF